MTYDQIVEARRALQIKPFLTLQDVGFDGPWVTPYQIASKSIEGPVLVALHWLDAPSIDQHRSVLQRLGYLPQIRFNRVMDLALQARSLQRKDVYVTQAFHLVPQTRSERISRADLDASFDAVTRHELAGRKVLTLGSDAAATCKRFGIAHTAVCHPSQRGLSHADTARIIAAGLASLGF